nr:glycosyltransferase N-terminal domain-containing protein [Allomuricauda sp.]
MYFSTNLRFVRFLYSFLVHVSWWLLHILALFKQKLKLFVSGRKETFGLLKAKISEEDSVIWMHVASLGEYEQGLPVLQKLKEQYPNHKLLLTFFSPSGYEVKKSSTPADVVVYLPLDTLGNARKFMEMAHPKLAIFVKYEIWPNYLAELRKVGVPTILVSALFSQRQIYFKPWGGFMRKSLKTFSHFFVQNEDSKKLLGSLGFDNVIVSGDTRFDRVSEILKRNNQLDFMDSFKGAQLCFVAGSTWPEDEEVFVDFINSTSENFKTVIAPHDIKPSHIEKLTSALSKKVVVYSRMENQDLSQAQVLIIDTVGMLTKVYSYADISYVGGGFATGLHNTLEPAAFGIPVIIGPQYKGFKEAEELVKEKGIHVINNRQEFASLFNQLVTDSEFRGTIGKINSTYIQNNQGASEVIVEHIQSLL